MFHLLAHTHGSGGASLLVDGFHAARILRREDPAAYRVLSQVRVPTHASGNEGISIQPAVPMPVLYHHPVTGHLLQVRWNNDDRATMDHWESEQDLEAWYDAARKWAHVEYWEQLRPGRPLSKSSHSSDVLTDVASIRQLARHAWARSVHGKSEDLRCLQ